MAALPLACSRIPPATQAKMEFPEGWGVQAKKPSVAGVWIFSGMTQSRIVIKPAEALIIMQEGPLNPRQKTYGKNTAAIKLCISKVNTTAHHITLFFTGNFISTIFCLASFNMATRKALQ